MSITANSSDTCCSFRSQLSKIFLTLNRSFSDLPPITVTCHTDNRGDFYFDGTLVAQTDWDGRPMQFTVATLPRVIAIIGYDYGGGFAIMLHTNAGQVTDTTWKCSGSSPPGSWKYAGFDDSSWDDAVVAGHSAEHVLGCGGATSIWGSCWSSCLTTDCRKQFY